MKLTISTRVQAPWQIVKDGFNESLFLKLNPPFPKVRLLRFDGSRQGDTVHLELNFLLFKQDWISIITFDEENTDGYTFIDEGKKLPFFLSQWRHTHTIKKFNEQESIIVDAIEFQSFGGALSFLLYPVLYLQFLYRKPVYKKFFKTNRPKSQN